MVATSSPSTTRLFSETWCPPNRQPQGAAPPGLAEHPQVVQAGVAAAFPVEPGHEALGVVEHVLQAHDRGHRDVRRPADRPEATSRIAARCCAGRCWWKVSPPWSVGRVEPAPALGVGRRRPPAGARPRSPLLRVEHVQPRPAASAIAAATSGGRSRRRGVDRPCPEPNAAGVGWNGSSGPIRGVLIDDLRATTGHRRRGDDHDDPDRRAPRPAHRDRLHAGQAGQGGRAGGARGADRADAGGRLRQLRPAPASRTRACSLLRELGEPGHLDAHLGAPHLVGSPASSPTCSTRRPDHPEMRRIA